jgi:hypothetical protein
MSCGPRTHTSPTSPDASTRAPGSRSTGLGQPVALDDLHAGDVAEPAGDLGRHGRGSDHHVAHAAPIDAADVGVLEEGDQHRRSCQML